VTDGEVAIAWAFVLTVVTVIFCWRASDERIDVADRIAPFVQPSDPRRSGTANELPRVRIYGRP
jgi:hypothetical protein